MFAICSTMAGCMQVCNVCYNDQLVKAGICRRINLHDHPRYQLGRQKPNVEHPHSGKSLESKCDGSCYLRRVFPLLVDRVLLLVVA